MPTTANHSRLVRRRSRRKRSHLQPHATRRPTRLAASGQLMAQGAGLLLPRLSGVSLIRRVVADDRLVVMLAKSLVELDIAVPVDWRMSISEPIANLNSAKPCLSIEPEVEGPLRASTRLGRGTTEFLIWRPENP
jgi:hypothetical protein